MAMCRQVQPRRRERRGLGFAGCGLSGRPGGSSRLLNVEMHQLARRRPLITADRLPGQARSSRSSLISRGENV